MRQRSRQEQWNVLCRQIQIKCLLWLLHDTHHSLAQEFPTLNVLRAILVIPLHGRSPIYYLFRPCALKSTLGNNSHEEDFCLYMWSASGLQTPQGRQSLSPAVEKPVSTGTAGSAYKSLLSNETPTKNGLRRSVGTHAWHSHIKQRGAVDYM